MYLLWQNNQYNYHNNYHIIIFIISGKSMTKNTATKSQVCLTEIQLC